MKLSAWHKAQGDSVEWYEPMFSGHMDKVYMSKVFSFTPDYEYFIDADEIVKGGSGYCISLVDGKEQYDKSRDKGLPYEVEHIYPDYSIYYGKVKDIENTAYGFCSRGCPRGCGFCHVKDKEGLCSHKVADLSEFWNGQKYISLCDPNVLACRDWKDILQQLKKQETPTSIQVSNTRSEDADSYNLQGMKVVNESSGNSHIRVMKGRKVVVR